MRQAHGLATPRSLLGREFVPSWEVEVRPGETVILNGTVQQVHAQLTALNPNWEAERANATASQSHLERRNVFPEHPQIFCGIMPMSWNFGPLTRSAIDYLSKVPGSPRNDAGPGNCGRISCEWNTGVWWCNDASALATKSLRRAVPAGRTLTLAPQEHEPKTLGSFNDIADGLRRIDQNYACALEGSAQVFHPDNWNVMIGGWYNMEC